MGLLDRRAACLGLLAAAGCGFRPLYGPGGTGAQALFGAVRVETETGELGYRIREALLKRLRPPRPDAPLTLSVKSALRRAGLAIEDGDEITRYNLTLTLDYALRRIGAPAEAEPLTRGEARSIAAFNATPSQYATLVSEREVRARAAADAVDKIVRRLSADFESAWLV